METYTDGRVTESAKAKGRAGPSRVPLSRRQVLGGIGGLALASAGSLASSRVAHAQPTSQIEKPTIANLVYGSVNGNNLLADLYAPTNGAATPWPWTMYIHGGAWQNGDKSEVAQADSPYAPTLLALQAAGYAVLSINYRLYPVPWPAEIEDCKLAIRSFRAQAASYGLDPNRAAVWGSSSGGHLAQLCDAADASAGWDVGAYLDVSSTPQVVVSWYGATDLLTLYNEAKQKGSVTWTYIETVFGTSSAAQFAASPVTYFSAGDPPIGFWHGQDDIMIYPDQMTEADRTCKAKGVSDETKIVLNAGHGFRQIGAQPISPSLAQIAQEVVDWVQQFA